MRVVGMRAAADAQLNAGGKRDRAGGGCRGPELRDHSRAAGANP